MNATEKQRQELLPWRRVLAMTWRMKWLVVAVAAVVAIALVATVQTLRSGATASVRLTMPNQPRPLDLERWSSRLDPIVQPNMLEATLRNELIPAQSITGCEVEGISLAQHHLNILCRAGTEIEARAKVERVAQLTNEEIERRLSVYREIVEANIKATEELRHNVETGLNRLDQISAIDPNPVAVSESVRWGERMLELQRLEEQLRADAGALSVLPIGQIESTGPRAVGPRTIGAAIFAGFFVALFATLCLAAFRIMVLDRRRIVASGITGVR